MSEIIVIVARSQKFVLLTFFADKGHIMELIHTKIEAIICPGCGIIVKGIIKQYKNIPFEDYYAECHKCSYIITESDWTPAGSSFIID